MEAVRSLAHYLSVGGDGPGKGEARAEVAGSSLP